MVVRAPRLEAAALLASLESGDFYASTGVALDTYAADAASIALRVTGRRRHAIPVRARRRERRGGAQWRGRRRVSRWPDGAAMRAWSSPIRTAAGLDPAGVSRLGAARAAAALHSDHAATVGPPVSGLRRGARRVPVPDLRVGPLHATSRAGCRCPNAARRPRPTRRRPPEVDVYRQLVRGAAAARKRWRPWLRALAGLGAAAGVAGLFLGRARGRRASRSRRRAATNRAGRPRAS